EAVGNKCVLATEFRTSNDNDCRHVGHVERADEGQEVICAERIEFNVLHDHHFVGGGGEEGIVDDFVDVLAVTPREELHGLGGPLRRADEAGAFEVFTHGADDRGVGFGHGIGHGGTSVGSGANCS